MQLVDEQNKISVSDLDEMTANMFDDLVKAVVDVRLQIMMVDAEMHADEEAVLLENGSKQNDLWGLNLYPEFYGEEDFIEYDSMINLRPSQNNRTRGISDENLRKTITEIVQKLVVKSSKNDSNNVIPDLFRDL